MAADDQGDDLTDDGRRALHEALSPSSESAEAGRLRAASAILGELNQALADAEALRMPQALVAPDG